MNSFDIVSCRLVKDREINTSYSIRNPNDAIRLIVENFNDLDREYIFIINCDNRLKPTNINIVSMGVENGAIINPKTFFRTSILSNASNVFLLHNHPSDILDPSKQDIKLYEQLKKAGEILDIKVLDSIIFNYDKEFYSLENKKNVKLQEEQYSNEDVIDFSNKIMLENNQEEDIYKRVCNNYINTTSNMKVLEEGKSILFFHIEDVYSDKKDEINLTNYEEYLDKNYEINKYSNYKEMFEKNVKEEILIDFEDVGITDEKGNWNFYISTEDIKNIGLSKEVKDFLKEFIDEENIETTIKLIENFNEV